MEISKKCYLNKKSHKTEKQVDQVNQWVPEQVAVDFIFQYFGVWEGQDVDDICDYSHKAYRWYQVCP